MDLGMDKLQGVADRLARLPSRYRMIAIVAIPLLVGGAYFQLAWRPARQELANLVSKQQNLQRKLNEVRSVAANLAAFEAEIQNLEAELRVALRQLPDSKELPGLLTDITTLGKKAGLEFKSFRPKREVPRGFYAEVPIDIEFTGGYHEIATFFDRISKLDRIVNVGDLKMAVAGEDVNATELRVSGQATTFRFLEGGGA
jgi:type IV pilus assembly protein PilO